MATYKITTGDGRSFKISGENISSPEHAYQFYEQNQEAFGGAKPVEPQSSAAKEAFVDPITKTKEAFQSPEGTNRATAGLLYGATAGIPPFLASAGSALGNLISPAAITTKGFGGIEKESQHAGEYVKNSINMTIDSLISKFSPDAAKATKDYMKTKEFENAQAILSYPNAPFDYLAKKLEESNHKEAASAVRLGGLSLFGGLTLKGAMGKGDVKPSEHTKPKDNFSDLLKPEEKGVPEGHKDFVGPLLDSLAEASREPTKEAPFISRESPESRVAAARQDPNARPANWDMREEPIPQERPRPPGWGLAMEKEPIEPVRDPYIDREPNPVKDALDDVKVGRQPEPRTEASQAPRRLPTDPNKPIEGRQPKRVQHDTTTTPERPYPAGWGLKVDPLTPDKPPVMAPEIPKVEPITAAPVETAPALGAVTRDITPSVPHRSVRQPNTMNQPTRQPVGRGRPAAEKGTASPDPNPKAPFSKRATEGGAETIWNTILNSGTKVSVRNGKQTKELPAIPLREMLTKTIPGNATRLQKWQHKLMDHILSIIGDVPVTVDSIFKFNPGENAHFDPNNNIIALNPGYFKQGGAWQTIVHEAIHAATYNAIALKPQHPAVKSLGLLYEHLAKTQLALLDAYGMKDVHEFVSETFANPKFQMELFDIMLPKELIKTLAEMNPEMKATASLHERATNFFKEFVLTIGDLLGFDVPDHSALMQAVKLGSRVMHEVTRDEISSAALRAQGKFMGYEPIPAAWRRDKTSKKLPAEMSWLEKDTESVLDTIQEKMDKGEKFGESSYTFNLSSASFRTATDAIKAGASLAQKLLYHVDIKFRDVLHYENTLNQVGHEAIKAYSGLYTSAKGLFANTDQFRQDMKFLVDFEKHPEKWQKHPAQWYPTKDQMIEAGMSPRSAAVWEGMHGLWESKWDTIERIFNNDGKRPPERVPGYIPHFFRGAYAIHVRYVDPLNPTNVKSVAEYNFDTRKSAQSLLNSLNDQVHGQMINEGNKQWKVEVEFENPSAQHNTAGRELRSLISAASREKMPILNKVLDQIIKDSAKGIIAHALDRENITKKGHIAERAAMDGERGLNDKQLRDAIQAFGTYHEVVNRWDARNKFVTETMEPMLTKGFLDKDKGAFAERTIDMVNAYMGITPKVLDFMDTRFRDLAIKLGMEPSTAATYMNGLSRSAAMFYLGGSINYYITNMTQALQAYPILMQAAADIKAKYGKDVSTTKAIGNNFKDFSKILEEAKKIGATEPTQMEHLLNLSGNLSPMFNLLTTPATWIERGTRKLSFTTGYQLARQVMGHEEAIKYAADFTDKVAVPYSERRGSPLLFGQTPDVLRPATMFLTFQQHQLGLINNSIAIATSNFKQGNTGAGLKAVNSLIALQALNIGMFGLAGGAFSQLYDMMAYMWDWPSVKEIGRMIDRKFLDGFFSKHSDLATYGAISQALGFDVSGSGTGVSVNISTAFPRFVSLLATGTVLGLKQAAGNFDVKYRPSKKDWWEWAQGLPGNFRGGAEYMIKYNPEQMVDVLTGLAQERRVGKDINLPLDGYRTTTESQMRAVFGSLSLKERDAQLDEAIFNTHEQKVKELKGKYDQLLKEGKLNSAEMADVVKRLVDLSGQMPATTVQILKNYELQKQKTQEQRRFSPSVSGGKQYLRYKNIQQQGQ